MSTELLTDPVKFVSMCWPRRQHADGHMEGILLCDYQVEIMESVKDNLETLVYAGNQLGKDFITALIALWFFCSRSPCRIITSSSGQTQLESVLWGEMKNFINTSVIPLPIAVTHMHIRQIMPNGEEEPKSYIRGIVTNTVENMQGHHLSRGRDGSPRTLAIYDEASGIGDEFYHASATWAHRVLIIGNPLPCSNFFRNGAKGGNIIAPAGMVI
jgi:hypothetical protein